MTLQQDSLFERFLAPIFEKFLIDKQALKYLYESIDWQAATERLNNPTVVYPDYYAKRNFHGIEGGYLTIGAAVTYDAITQYVLPPNETMVRQGLLQTIRSQPRRILDLGCGTGSSTLLLKRRFPQAEVIGLDLSPYMLVAAEQKAQQSGLHVIWRHGLAEATGLPAHAFDLVTTSLLFHETPAAIAQAILQESFRLLTVGGEFVLLDGNQAVLRHTEWLNNIFEEPYIREYAAGNVSDWLKAAGFAAVQTQDHWLLHQLSRGAKPLANEESESAEAIRATDGLTPQWAMG
ncbi:MAG TPA: class I SAM-dependent methyltransferase [Leptolyngbyaceae cyanobacterium M33_DOE_097]|uniref:Class I SAM-dependent methyltransferase n=1 Tax=Oscillatoriales cyanobacterium SpSt-418 TaxID=2282169 RepID=A0A7C3KCR4_9CYAN|nr:class I SAM-dependent methyltransferase [Leptolyngbyaceae cyanobacterium M33_DOE_097]